MTIFGCFEAVQVGIRCIINKLTCKLTPLFAFRICVKTIFTLTSIELQLILTYLWKLSGIFNSSSTESKFCLHFILGNGWGSRDHYFSSMLSWMFNPICLVVLLEASMLLRRFELNSARNVSSTTIVDIPEWQSSAASKPSKSAYAV